MKMFSVLLVDDDKEDLEILTDALTATGYFHIQPGCSSLQELLDVICSRGRPDMIICDLHLKGPNALDVCRALADHDYGGIPFMVLSGSAVPDYMLAELQRYCIRDVLVKPCTLAGYTELAHGLIRASHAMSNAA